MATQRLPTVNGDDGTWGNILNSYLRVSLDSEGGVNVVNNSGIGVGNLDGEFPAPDDSQTVIIKNENKIVRWNAGTTSWEDLIVVNNFVWGTTVTSSNNETLTGFTKTLTNTQSTPITADQINLGTSPFGHTGLAISAPGAHTAQRGIQIDLGATGSGAGLEVVGSNAASYSALFNAGNVGIGTNTPTEALDIGEAGTATGTATQSSSSGIALTGSYWDGLAEVKHRFSLQNIASTTANEEGKLSIAWDGSEVFSIGQNGAINTTNYIDLPEITTPVDPAVDTARLYSRDDGGGNTRLYYRDSAGTEIPLTGGGSGTPGGADTQVQFNDGGVFGGDANFVWDKTNGRLGIGTTTPNNLLNIETANALEGAEIGSAFIGNHNAPTYAQFRNISAPAANGWAIGSGPSGDTYFNCAPGQFINFEYDNGTNIFARFDNTIIDFNYSNVDRDFRVRGATEDNLIYTDAANNRVGVGTATPNSILDVEGDHAFLPAPNAEMASVDFANSQWSFWIDETENTFKLKAKKSDGTILSHTIGEPSVIGQFYDSAGGTDVNTATPTAVPFNQESRKDTGITHDNATNNSRIYFDDPGWYRISYNISHQTIDNGEYNVFCQARMDGTTLITPSQSYSYMRRNANPNATNTATFIVQTSASDQYLEIIGQNSGDTGSSTTIANQSFVSVEKLDLAGGGGGGGSGLPAGANTQIQFNDGGVFGASANLIWDNSTSRLGLGTAAPTSTLDVEGGNAFLPAQNTEPVDGDFANSQFSVWIDETNDEFELKAKKSDGTVFSRTLGSVTATDVLPAAQARRTTDFTLAVATTWYDVPLDTTDIETDTTKIEHNATSTDNIDIKETGLYQITYQINANDASVTHGLETRVRINDATIIPGSYLVNVNYLDEYTPTTAVFFANLTAGDFITLQAMRTTANTVIGETTFTAVKMAANNGGASGAGDFADGGEAGGADRTLGNTDNFDLGLLTNGTPRVHIQNDGNVGIGTTTPNSTFEINGSYSLAFRTETNNYTIAADDSVIVADASTNPVIITLPTASGISGRVYRIKAVDITNTATISTTGAETIDGQASITFATQYDSYTVISDGTNWLLI